MNKKYEKFQPVLLATADFANDTKFRIEQVNSNGACRVINAVTGKILNHIHNVVKAWARVRYSAKILQNTERSS